MRERYVCWDVTYEIDPGDAPRSSQVIEAFCVASAAEEYVEQSFDPHSWVNEVVINVRDPLGVIHTVDVDIDARIDFTGSVRA